MPRLAVWINAARLRTLPLSVSGVLVGSALANAQGQHDIAILVLAILTAVGFQITSNFANDYGDGVKGTDNDERIGPQRVLQSGLLTRKDLKKGIIISIIIDILLVMGIVYVSFGLDNMEYILLFMALGALSIWAAIKYTMGSSAYGYRGLGDLFVFLFFGILAVMGTMFLYTKNLTGIAFLPAIAIGVLSAGVLNLNNLRDHQSDKNAGKNTLVVKLGYSKAVNYHVGLLLVGFLSMTVYIALNYESWVQLIPLLVFIPMLLHAKRVIRAKNPSLLDPELKKLAMGIFALALLFYMINNIFS